MVLDLILLQAFHTGEDICFTVPQDVAKAALCECAVGYDFFLLHICMTKHYLATYYLYSDTGHNTIKRNSITFCIVALVYYIYVTLFDASCF